MEGSIVWKFTTFFLKVFIAVLKSYKIRGAELRQILGLNITPPYSLLPFPPLPYPRSRDLKFSYGLGKRCKFPHPSVGPGAKL